MSKALEEIALIRLRVTELKNKKSELLLRKKPIEAELSQLSNRVKSQNSHRTRLSPEEYRQICGRQAALKKKLAQIEVDITPISAEIRRLHADEDLIRADSGMQISNIVQSTGGDVDFLRKVAQIRDYWQQFAGDQTRVNSMRIMAAQFAEQLTSAISHTE